MIGNSVTPERNHWSIWVLPLLMTGLLGFTGCGIFSGLREKPFSITAIRLSPGGECEPQGIPYYLPKPLLIVAKNVRHIDESKVGLTGPAPIPGGFDNQSAYADVKANVTTPGGGEGGPAPLQSTAIAAAAVSGATQGTEGSKNYVAPHMTPDGRMEDGITPDSFYTYQIVFVPDLSQKYGLKINGGPGEVRAAMNMVNGWMYTGMGPFYLKDSSTAQNRIASGIQSMFAGRGAADVLNEVGEIAALPGTLGNPRSESGADKRSIDSNTLVSAFNSVAKMVERENLVPKQMLNYAEIYIYEPELMPDGQMQWDLIAEHHFDRDYMAPDNDKASSQMMPLLKQLMDNSGQREALPSPKAPTPVTPDPLNNIVPADPNAGAAIPQQESGNDPSGIATSNPAEASVPGSADALHGNMQLLTATIQDAQKINQSFQVLPDRSANSEVNNPIHETFQNVVPQFPSGTIPGNTINVNLGNNSQPIVKPSRKPFLHWLKKDTPVVTTKTSRVEAYQ